MAGTALAVGVVAAVATLCVGLVAVGGAAVTSQRMAGAADAAALAAADASSGAVVSSDTPCALAARVADAAGATMTDCAIQGVVATVQVRAAYSGLVAVASARAGSPGEK